MGRGVAGAWLGKWGSAGSRAAHQACRRARAVRLNGCNQKNMMLELFRGSRTRQAGQCRPGAVWQVRVYAGAGEALDLHAVFCGSSLIRRARVRRTRSCAPSLRARRSKWLTSSSWSRRSCASTWPPWASAASTTWSAAPTCSRRVPAAASYGIADYLMYLLSKTVGKRRH